MGWLLLSRLLLTFFFHPKTQRSTIDRRSFNFWFWNFNDIIWNNYRFFLWNWLRSNIILVDDIVIDINLNIAIDLFLFWSISLTSIGTRRILIHHNSSISYNIGNTSCIIIPNFAFSRGFYHISWNHLYRCLLLRRCDILFFKRLYLNWWWRLKYISNILATFIQDINNFYFFWNILFCFLIEHLWCGLK